MKKIKDDLNKWRDIQYQKTQLIKDVNFYQNDLQI